MRISVIVVCHNPGPRLPATLASIWEQRWAGPELIVVDRGSTDGTREWLESQRARIAAILASGAATLYDALNEGIAQAQGEWVLLLSAEDRLVGDMVLSEALNWMMKTEAGVAAGEAAYDDGRITKLRSHVNPAARNFVARPATFYRRTLFAENGGFDPAFPTMADYEFNVRLWKNRVRFKPVPLRIAASRSEVTTGRFDGRACREEMQVRHRYFGFWRCVGWDALSLIRWAGAGMARVFLRPH